MPLVSRGFRRRHPAAPEGTALPPGQHLVGDFPVLSAGPTPRVPLDRWDLAVDGAVAHPRRWSWEEFRALPSERITVDIHCVTSWSKLDVTFGGLSVDELLAIAGPLPEAAYVMAHSTTGYTTNLPLADVAGGKAWLAWEYDGRPLTPEHGGPVRLLVPHLYFWKSAKFVTRLELMAADRPGFWEQNGYHDRGDPWLEQRYQGDP
jgi:DMSO/TMAO reductase YedYZ molybdopterin-dependent catalytic subunit